MPYYDDHDFKETGNNIPPYYEPILNKKWIGEKTKFPAQMPPILVPGTILKIYIKLIFY